MPEQNKEESGGENGLIFGHVASSIYDKSITEDVSIYNNIVSNEYKNSGNKETHQINTEIDQLCDIHNEERGFLVQK